jgi:hypothetical protein
MDSASQSDGELKVIEGADRAMCSRADPVDAVEIIRRYWSGPLDPIIPKERSSTRVVPSNGATDFPLPQKSARSDHKP